MRKLGPLPAAHPALERRCAVCEIPFAVGDYLALVAQADPEDVAALVVAVLTKPAAVVHWDCRPAEA